MCYEHPIDAICHLHLDVVFCWEMTRTQEDRFAVCPFLGLRHGWLGLLKSALGNFGKRCNPAVPCDAQPGSLEGNWNNAFFGLWDGTVDDFAAEQANNVRCLPF